MKKYQSLFMESFIKDIKDSLLAIKNIFDMKDIKFVVIGAASLSAHGYNRLTEDIDVLVKIEDKEKILNLPIGFIRDKTKRGKTLYLHQPKTQIDVLYSNENAGSNDGISYHLNRKDIIEIDGIYYPKLYKLIEIKLSSGIYGKRYKDLGDVQELISLKKLDRNYARNNNFRSDLISKYEQIWDGDL